MVKKIILFLTYSLFFVLALIYFTPKVSLYYLLEQQMQSKGIVVSSEDIQDYGFYLGLKDADISMESIESAQVAKIEMNLFVFYNSISFDEITLSDTFKYFTPLHVESGNIVYSILNPLNITAHATGEFGELDAYFDLLEMSMHVNLKPSQMMLKNHKATLNNFKKNENGEFTYDQTF
ncbi:MAG: hypothetical protein U9N33_04700 [Campylobacterota bacterium]|nr:hypothetical protein [Campylobacterota bacterium]